MHHAATPPSGQSSPPGMEATGLATVSSYPFFSDGETPGVLNAMDPSEVRPVNARSLGSEPISTVLELNIGVG